jgi:hypothetical protein
MIRSTSVHDSIIFLFFLTATVGCAANVNVPQTETPLILQKSYNTSFDKAWDSVGQVVNTLGEVLTIDKNSGFMLCKMKATDPTLKQYVNVYVAKKADHGSIVYVTLYRWEGRWIQGSDKEFFDKLDGLLS